MILMALLLIFCLYFGGFIGWLFKLSSRFSMNIGIWTFVIAFGVFCFYK